MAPQEHEDDPEACEERPRRPHVPAITARRLLLVEGEDERRLVETLLRQDDLVQVPEIQVVMCWGVTRLRAVLAVLRDDAAFRDVLDVGVVRDADDDPAAAFQSAADAVKSVLPGVGPTAHGEFAEAGGVRRGIFVVPDGVSPGALEDLCLLSVDGDPAVPCVGEYIKCVTEAGFKPRPLGKARTHAFLASRERPYLRLGEAAEAKVWDLGHPVWNPLKDFLRDLAGS